MNKRAVWRLILLFAVLPVFYVARAQDNVACPPRHGDPTVQAVFPRYEYRNRRLILVDIQTGETIKEVETSLDTPEFRFMGWSPDCRYLVGGLGFGYGREYTTVIWDVDSGERITEFPRTYGNSREVHWHPNSRYVIVDGANGAKLFDTLTYGTLHLSDAPRDYLSHTPNAFNFVRWDDARHEVIASQVNGDVAAYNINSGQVTGYFHDPNSVGGDPQFALSPDNSRIVVFDFSSFLGVWNRDNLEQIRLVTHGYTAAGPDRVAISPNNQYLATAILFTVRVWDLSSPSDGVHAREPITTFYPNSMYSPDIRFVDEHTLELSDDDGTTQLWNILKGTQLSSVG